MTGRLRGRVVVVVAVARRQSRRSVSGAVVEGDGRGGSGWCRSGLLGMMLGRIPGCECSSYDLWRVFRGLAVALEEVEEARKRIGVGSGDARGIVGEVTVDMGSPAADYIDNLDLRKAVEVDFP